MIEKLCKVLLGWIGWSSVVSVEIPSKCVLCVAPHTSNLDFFIAKIFYRSIGGNPHFLMKKEWFFFPLGYLLKGIGGFPVNRSKKQSMTDLMIEEFNRRESFHLAVSPEGTRKRNPNWRTGFYYIAQGAQVPILLAYLDYQKKEIGITKVFIPSGDEKKDMNEIKLFFRDFRGRHPEKFTI